MVTSLMSPPFVSPFPLAGTTPTLISGLNAAIGVLVGPPPAPQPRRPRVRTFELPQVAPSVLSAVETGWVCDALNVVAAARPRVSWQTVARFLGWMELQYQYGCGGDTAAIAADVWEKMKIKLQVCGGDQEQFLPAGLALMKEFAGYAADAEVEPILLWLALADVLTKPAGAPRQTTVTIAAE